MQLVTDKKLEAFNKGFDLVGQQLHCRDLIGRNSVTDCGLLSISVASCTNIRLCFIKF